MTDETTTGAARDGGPGLTDGEKLAALDAYMKILKPIADELRARVTKEMGRNHDERKGAFLPDGTKLASITRSDGAKKARVTDVAAALAWCKKQHPENVYTVEAIRPAYLDLLLDVAGSLPVGSKGVDVSTGEELPFIEVQQGSPYVTITGTKEGKARMAGIAHGFAGMLEAPKYGPGPAYDPDFADRLENGAGVA